MRTSNIFSLFIILFSINGFAQTTITLQPDAAEGRDAEIFSLEPGENYGNVDLLRGNAWTFQQNPGWVRSFLDFDFSEIPAGSVIQSAYLSLYAPDDPSTQFHSGSNSFFIRKINSYWHEDEITWSNQPSFEILNQLYMDASTEEYQDYEDINVTTLVQDMFANPSSSFGFMISLQQENPLARISFVSSDYADASKHPKLIIQYEPPDCTSLVLQPGTDGMDAEIFSLEPQTNYNGETFRGNAWTFGGADGFVRGLLQFDLSAIPGDAIINLAHLTLYPPVSPHSQYNEGANNSYIQRITSSWSESSVNWNNQPSVTAINDVVLHESALAYQEYRSIDVTGMVQDMITDPNSGFGFMLKLTNEEVFRRLGFASSDYANPERHPKLEICYTTSIGIEPVTDESLVKVIPNPAHDVVRVEQSGDPGIFKLQVSDSLGKVVLTNDFYDGSDIPVKHFPAGIYFFSFTDAESGVVSISRVVKQ